ncbi:hypothetical protein NECID01_2197, partial [Nematocida sp. AWRm77]
APGIDLDEFDGLVKICFSRKNKTLGAIFRQAAVKNLIFNNMAGLGALEEEADFPEEEAQITEAQEEALARAISESGLEKERASKMAVEDFLFLLIRLKECGVSFSS